MHKVKVKFLTTLKEIVGKNEIELEFEEPITIADLLSLLVKHYGKGFEDYIYSENGKIRSFLQFLVNGRSVTLLDGFKTKLKNGDSLVIMPPVAGG